MKKLFERLCIVPPEERNKINICSDNYNSNDEEVFVDFRGSKENPGLLENIKWWKRTYSDYYNKLLEKIRIRK